MITTRHFLPSDVAIVAETVRDADRKEALSVYGSVSGAIKSSVKYSEYLRTIVHGDDIIGILGIIPGLFESQIWLVTTKRLESYKREVQEAFRRILYEAVTSSPCDLFYNWIHKQNKTMIRLLRSVKADFAGGREDFYRFTIRKSNVLP